jgi:DNA invertase Pin-like site-specific DNA recombinase
MAAPLMAVAGRRRGASDDDAADDDESAGSPVVCGSYSRFSSALQDAASITDQQRRCQQQAEQDGFTITAEFEFSDAAVSGTRPDRDGLLAMLEAARGRRFQVLYIENLSRLARESVISMPLLKELVHVCGVRVISVTEGIDSENESWDLLATILGIQHERFVKDLGKYVLRGQEGVLLEGYSVGDYCFGYTSEPVEGTEQNRRGRNARPHRRYVIDQNQAKWVQQVFRWFVVEKRSLTWIVKELTRRGAPKDHRATTTAWHHTLVRGLLQNQKYVGRWSWGKRQNRRNPFTGRIRQEMRPQSELQRWVRESPELRIIDDATFQAAQERLDEFKHRFRRRTNGQLAGSRVGQSSGQPRHLLSGLLRCGECGSRFHVCGTGGRYLGCPNRHNDTCTCRTTIRRDLAERLILEEISRRIADDQNWRQAIHEHCLEEWKTRQRELPSALRDVEQELQATERKIERLVDLIEEGAAPPEVADRLHQRRNQRDQLSRRLEELQRVNQQAPPEPTPEWVDEQLNHLDEILRTDEPAAALTLRGLVGGAIEMTQIRLPDRKRHHFDGRFQLRHDSPCPGAADSGDRGNSKPDLPAGSEVVIVFREAMLLDTQSEEAKQLYDQGLMNVEIARQLGMSKSRVTKVLHHWFDSRGMTMPDGRSRRAGLDQKSVEPPLYQRTADAAKDLWHRGRLLWEIADELDCDRNTVTKALTFWHESRGLPVPNNRRRRLSE